MVHLGPDGTVTDHWTGLTAVVALAIGTDNALYALEMATGNTDSDPFLSPDSGRVVRQTGPDDLKEVVPGLAYPVAMDFGPDGDLYVGYPAFGPDLGEDQGAIIRLDISSGTPLSLTGLATPAPPC